MKKFSIFIPVFIFALSSIFLSYSASAADFGWRFMHNDHDTLVLCEVLEVDNNYIYAKSADWIVGSGDLNEGDGERQLKPEFVRFANEYFRYNLELKAGDYVLVSLDKIDDENFQIANSIYLVSSLDAESLIVYSPFEGAAAEAAAVTVFVNSGGVINEFAFEGSTRVEGGASVYSTRVYNKKDGKEVIYDTITNIVQYDGISTKDNPVTGGKSSKATDSFLEMTLACTTAITLYFFWARQKQAQNITP